MFNAVLTRLYLRLRCPVMLIILASQIATACANGALTVPLSERIGTGDQFMGIRLLGNLRLPNAQVDGYPLAGISALAWDEDESILYALSDLGIIFHLHPKIENNLLVDTTIKAAYPLRDIDGHALRKPWKDSEGMFANKTTNGIKGDSELTVCFEVKQRIRRYTAKGNRLGGIALPPELTNIRRFANPNISLEAISQHPQWGLLIGPERPLRNTPRNRVTIYSATQNLSWQYPLHNAPNSSLVAIETLADGSLLTLERAFVSITRPLIIALRRVRLDTPVQAENVAVFDTSQGWLLDNFEGLTHYRHNRFFIVSDDNRNFLQSTLLLYFELL